MVPAQRSSQVTEIRIWIRNLGSKLKDILEASYVPQNLNALLENISQPDSGDLPF